MKCAFFSSWWIFFMLCKSWAQKGSNLSCTPTLHHIWSLIQELLFCNETSVFTVIQFLSRSCRLVLVFNVSPRLLVWSVSLVFSGFAPGACWSSLTSPYTQSLASCVTVLRVIILLEGNPSAHSEVLHVLDQVSMTYILLDQSEL